MLDVFTKILTIAFTPLLGLSKDIFLRIHEPKRKMVKDLLKLYEDLESVEYHSKRLIQEVESYINDNRIAWTVVRNKKKALVDRSEELKNAANQLGRSLQNLYMVFEIQDKEMLGHLVSIFHGKKQFYGGRILAIPQINYYSGTSREGSALILIPTDTIMTITYDDQSIEDFYHHPEKIKKNYLKEIDLDNKDEVILMIERARPLLSEIGVIREKLKEFIKNNFSIEDYFR